MGKGTREEGRGEVVEHLHCRRGEYCLVKAELIMGADSLSLTRVSDVARLLLRHARLCVG